MVFDGDTQEPLRFLFLKWDRIHKGYRFDGTHRRGGEIIVGETPPGVKCLSHVGGAIIVEKETIIMHKMIFLMYKKTLFVLIQ